MDILTIILLLVCILFSIYKAVFRMMRHIEDQKNQIKRIRLKNTQIDERFYSHASFDFPNMQSESEMEIMNSGTKKQKKIHVKQYCKY